MNMFFVRGCLIVTAALCGLYVGVHLQRGRKHSYINLTSNNIEPQRTTFFSAESLVFDRRVTVPLALHRKYLAEYSTAIDGWFNYEVLYVIWTLTQFQYDDLHLIGAIGEIGVHHGKLTCYLYLMRRYEEQILFAVDVFEKQALNKDNSGLGRKDIFLNNVKTYADLSSSQLLIYSGSSLDLNPSFSKDKNAVSWWHSEILEQQGIQIISVSYQFKTIRQHGISFFLV